MDSQILIVDDDPDILRLLKDNLELDGYRVRAASTGKEAFSLFEQCSPDIIILDLGLPDMDGVQVCGLIRQNSAVPIIMLTARDRGQDRILGLAAGADGYLVKPFDYRELSASVRAHLEPGPPSGFPD
jgi:DNA-binding response OmpR family regulator